MAITSSKPGWLSPSLALSLIIAVLTAGASYGAISLSIATLREDVALNKQSFKELNSVYMRIDVYEAKHKALEDKIDTMAKNVEDIKFYLMGKR